MNSEAIGARLAAVRKSLGFTQKQVAHYLGVKREAIAYVESGARQITTTTLTKLADLYGYKVSHFIDDAKEEPPHVSIAFRVTDLSDSDLEIIASVKRIASNLGSLNSLLGVEK